MYWSIWWMLELHKVNWKDLQGQVGLPSHFALICRCCMFLQDTACPSIALHTCWIGMKTLKSTPFWKKAAELMVKRQMSWVATTRNAISKLLQRRKEFLVSSQAIHSCDSRDLMIYLVWLIFSSLLSAVVNQLANEFACCLFAMNSFCFLASSLQGCRCCQDNPPL